MSNLIPLDQAGQLPAHLSAFASEGNEFGFSGTAYPSISLKGKVFTIVRDKERTLVTKPGGEGEPAPALEVVIINSAPKGGLYARTFYSGGYVEGGNAKPECSSDDGVSPVAGATDKQSAKCSLCPQNAVGSGATAQNPKAKACRSSKLLAVAPAGQLNDPMLLRVPGDSLMPLGEYGDWLAKRGVKSAAVVTRIGFDYSVAHPKLTFKAIGGITQEMSVEVLEQMTSPVVNSIIGNPAAAAPALSAPAAPAAPAEKPATPAPMPTPAPAAPVEAAVAPKTKVKKAEAKVAAPAAALDDALAALDFDD